MTGPLWSTTESNERMSLVLSSAVAGAPIALLQGALVFLPRRVAFERLRQLRRPGWAALLPGSLIFGTFGPLLAPPMSAVLIVLAAVTTPILALLAVSVAVRRRLLVLGAALIVVSAVVNLDSAPQLALTATTALACLCGGVVLERLIPRGWLAFAVVAMAAVDVALLSSGLASRPSAMLAAAEKHLGGFELAGARIGGGFIGYPDLVLAGILGAAVADDALRPHAAGLVFILAIVINSMVAHGAVMPATPPLAITLVLVDAIRAGRTSGLPRRGGGYPPLREGGSRELTLANDVSRANATVVGLPPRQTTREVGRSEHASIQIARAPVTRGRGDRTCGSRGDGSGSQRDEPPHGTRRHGRPGDVAV